jgi:hypothetical protein
MLSYKTIQQKMSIFANVLYFFDTSPIRTFFNEVSIIFFTLLLVTLPLLCFSVQLMTAFSLSDSS